MGVGLLFEEGGFFGRVGGIFLVFDRCERFSFLYVVVEMMLNCDNSSSIIVVGRFFLFSFCRCHRCSAYVINRAFSLHCLV